jgi:hypothetical protein
LIFNVAKKLGFYIYIHLKKKTNPLPILIEKYQTQTQVSVAYTGKQTTITGLRDSILKKTANQ